MEPFRIHLKVGPHEFEAQGEQEAVERQAALWRELITSHLASPPPPAHGTPSPGNPAAPGRFQDYDRIFRHEGRVVSLSVLPQGESVGPNAALLVLLGRKYYEKEDLVGGAAVLEGLSRSGIEVERADRAFDTHIPGNVLRTGRNRGVKYRLTNVGATRAEEIARELAAVVG